MKAKKKRFTSAGKRLKTEKSHGKTILRLSITQKSAEQGEWIGKEFLIISTEFQRYRLSRA